MLDKHHVSKLALKRLEKVMFAQDEIGVAKYNTVLMHTLPYNWGDMADEELADFHKYRECEKERIRSVMKLLNKALESDYPKEWVQAALDTLNISGTENKKLNSQSPEHIAYDEQLREFMQSTNPTMEQIEQLKEKYVAKGATK
jgi:hypothetical protein